MLTIDEPLGRHGGNLAEAYGLRGHDAVHLACALSLAARRPDCVVATWDQDLAGAASLAGLPVVPRVP